MRVAEFVPEISALARLGVRALQVASAADGPAGPPMVSRGGGDLFEHHQVRGARLVQSGNQGVHGPDGPAACDDQTRPSLARERGPRSIGDRLERTHDGCSHGHHSMTGASGGVDEIGGLPRHAIELFVRRLVILEACDTRVEQQRRDLDAARDEASDELRCERPPG